MRFRLATTLAFLPLLTVSGCVIGPQPNVTDVQRWMTRIEPGSSVAHARQVMREYLFVTGENEQPPSASEPGYISGRRLVSGCICTLSDTYIEVTVYYNINGKVTEVVVSTGVDAV